MSAGRWLWHRRLRIGAAPIDLYVVANSLRSRLGLAPSLRPRDRARVRRLRRPDQRRAALIGSGLLRHALRARFRRPLPAGALEQRTQRRPRHRSLNAHRRAVLTLSHSAHWVAVAITQGHQRRIGIDIEDCDRRIDAGVARKLPWPDAERAGTRSRLLMQWCCAEAALKADGRGLPALDRLIAQSATRLSFTDRAEGALMLRRLEGLPRGCVGAIAVGRRQPRTQVRTSR
ncbi:MAG: hypothetical protein V2I63_04680 [Pseudomonadales bacterium]|jgi:phosphopantetheinyl transferase|nr:hypothetical protein [Pseudomonadales bacterium]